MRLLAQVLENYRSTYALFDGRATRNDDSVVQQIVLQELPKFFRGLLASQGREGDFKVEGSIGSGNMPKIPWVGVFNNLVTGSAQEGYYIVMLFSEDMQSCYLSLNQGVTGLKTQFGEALSKQKMRTAAQRALQFFEPHADALRGPIVLGASAHLGKGYEQGAIESYRYDLLTLPDEGAIGRNFLDLLRHYDRLVAVAGPSLSFLAPITEYEFNRRVLEKAVNLPATDSVDEPRPVPSLLTSKKSAYKRNVDFAALALLRADFRCEVDATHETFLSRARNRRYVEAHHLIPMSRQGGFEYSLDVPANIVALCATCHKLLHHGRLGDKREHLLKLLAKREAALVKVKLMTDGTSLLGYYGADLSEDE